MVFKYAFIITVATLANGAFTCSTEAHSDLGGLMPYVSDGQIVTGHYAMHDGSGLVTDPGPTYVYITELQSNWEGSGMPGIDEPGIVTDGSSPNDPDGQLYSFPANTALTVTANLLPDLNWNIAFWDGSGDVDFVQSPHALTIEDGFNEIVLDGDSNSPVGSVSPWISDANGEGHAHLEFLLNEPEVTAAAGIYLFSLSFNANGFETSDPVYYVAGYGLEESLLEEAIETAGAWAEANLVPEPGSLSLGALALLCCLARRRTCC